MATLYWIRGETKEWKQFVQLRVNEIATINTTLPTSLQEVSRLQSFQTVNYCSGPEWLTEHTQPNADRARRVKLGPRIVP